MELNLETFPTGLPAYFSVFRLPSASADDNNITFFGSIPCMVENIDIILRQLVNSDSQVCGNNQVFDAFIDVSSTLAEPVIIRNWEEITRRKYMLLELKESLGAKWNDEKPYEWKSSLDLCFVTGAILGYPIIYCNTTPATGNCLSHQPLTHYTVSISSQCLPPIYSFTVPAKFAHRYQSRVEQWFHSLCSRTNHHLVLNATTESHPLILT